MTFATPRRCDIIQMYAVLYRRRLPVAVDYS